MKPQKTHVVQRLLRSQGWYFVRAGRGSHEIWSNHMGTVKIAIPAGHEVVSAGVLQQLKKSGLEIPRNWR